MMTQVWVIQVYNSIIPATRAGDWKNQDSRGVQSKDQTQPVIAEHFGVSVILATWKA
jgi:hypothetical protein